MTGGDLVQVFIQIAGIAGIFLFTIRYIVNKNTEREEKLLTHQDQILLHHENQQAQMLDFYKNKNDHMERISTDFAETLRGNTKAVSELTTEIKLLKKN